MKRWRSEVFLFAGVGFACLLGTTGCSTIGGAASDLGLAGAGGVAGYDLSGHRVGGAAAGAAAGYIISKVAQSEVQRTVSDAEKRGYDRALNQAVKQQYWIIQDQQRSRDSADARSVRYVPVQLPETTVGGVIHNPTVAYVPVEP
jgi:hypothetical protein